MPEEFDEETKTSFDIEHYRDLIRRRHVVFLAFLLAGWGLVWGLGWILPSQYESSTMILVEQPALPKDYIVPNVSDTLQDRLQSITQQIMSRTRLLSIADKLHLYESNDQNFTPEAKVELMRKDIAIELVRDTQNNTITAFRVSYTAPDRQTAQQVTKELTNLFIDENVRVRQRQSEAATSFLQGQLARARSAMADQDAKVRAFRAAHEGSLPSQQASNLQILGGLQAQLQTEQGNLNAAKQQRIYHESMIEQYRAADKAARATGNAPGGLSAIDRQLATLRSELTDLSTRYTDQYPEVQKVKSEIAKTQQLRGEMVARMQDESKAASNQSTSLAESVSDPANAIPLEQLQRQFRADQADISAHQQAIRKLEAKIGSYQARLSAEPAVEQQLSDLTHQYDQSQKIYNDLLKKESDSQMATRMEQMQEGDRFTVIDPPSLPSKPKYPNRLHVSAAGFGVGLGISTMVVFLLELVDDRLHRDKDIAKLLPVTVLSEIPEIFSPAEERRNQRKVLWGWALAISVAMIILAGTAFSYMYLYS